MVRWLFKGELLKGELLKGELSNFRSTPMPYHLWYKKCAKDVCVLGVRCDAFFSAFVILLCYFVRVVGVAEPVLISIFKTRADD